MKAEKTMYKSNWEKVFKHGQYRGRYPTEDVIRFIQLNFPRQPERKNIKILDWGSGTGRHMRYLAGEGFLAYGAEGSTSGVKLTKKWLKRDKLKGRVVRINDVRLPFPDNFFDAIIECAALQHNKPTQIKKIISELHRVLKPGGRIFSLCKSERDYLFKKGEKIEKNTYYIEDSPDTKTMADTIIHFFNEKELRLLWKRFNDVKIEHTERTTNNMTRRVSHFIVTAKK